MKLSHRAFRARGTVLLVVLTLLAVMSVLMLTVGHSLFSVKSELKRIEKRQLQRYGTPPPAKEK